MDHSRIIFPAHGQFERETISLPKTIGPNEVRGETVATLISPGTELGWATGDNFPIYPGYAAVFSADEMGSEVKGISPGTLLFCMGPHRSFQQIDARSTLPVPESMPAETALLTRLMGVSMTTLMTTAARPGDKVIICGIGPVGFLAAQIFVLSGYDVLVIEPDDDRRGLVSSLCESTPRIPVDDPAIAGKVALVVDCSGNEQAVLDGCQVVRQLGEVVLVGVPWKRQTEIFAHELLSLVFTKFVILRSGWEFEIPLHGVSFDYETHAASHYNNSPQSIFACYEKALRWIADGRISADGLITKVDPRTPEVTYRDIMQRKMKGLFTVFDWAKMS